MKTIRIEVTEQDIERGEYCSVRGCAMALAIERAIPLADTVGVDPERILLWDFENRQTVLLNPLPNFVAAFDAFKRPYSLFGRCNPRPNPISFNLDVPDCFVPQEPTRAKVAESTRDSQPMVTLRQSETSETDTLRKQEKMEQF